MTPKAPQFKQGDNAGAYEVLKHLGHYKTERNQHRKAHHYNVKCLQCGTVSDVSQDTLRASLKNRARMCLTCALQHRSVTRRMQPNHMANKRPTAPPPANEASIEKRLAGMTVKASDWWPCEVGILGE